MPTVSTRCPSCLHHIDIAAGHCALLGGPDGQPVAYALVCPLCGEPIVRAADRRTVAMLIAGGASPVGAEERAAGRPHPELPPSGPPLQIDDLIDFHLLLEGTDWFARLVALQATDAPGRPASSAPAQGPRRDRGTARH